MRSYVGPAVTKIFIVFKVYKNKKQRHFLIIALCVPNFFFGFIILPVLCLALGVPMKIKKTCCKGK